MAFRFVKQESSNFSTPQEMFQDNKMKNIMGLIDYQSNMIDNYLLTIQDDGGIKDKHVAFELPTGSGKTLIGLLIGEFHRRKFHRKALFLCPTNQLVAQVCQQAKEKYGIETVAFTGKQADYSPVDRSDFFLAKKIGVTTYSSFFAVSEYFKETEILIFDDVHSSEQYIADNWSVCIQRGKFSVLYQMIAEIIKDTAVGESYFPRMSASSPYESDVMNWCNIVPMPMIEQKLSEIDTIIETHVDGTELGYSWRRIRDHLGECNIFVSWDSILIRPFIAPTLSFAPFKNALQCVYMSATLGKSGELERVTGVECIKRLPIVNEWDKKAIGRKFFIFPDLSFEASLHNTMIKELHQKTNKSTIIVPSNKEQEELTSFVSSSLPETKVYSVQDLIDNKEEFKQCKDAMVIMANRFDGIDFSDDECRMLVLLNLPNATNLQEKFFYSRMAASVLFSERIKTRIIQAVGRCTRNAKDYAVVCIIGNSVLNELINDSQITEYKPELRAEIKFGIENSTNLSDFSEILENVDAFLSRGNEWAGAEEHIVELRDSYIQQDDDHQNNGIFELLKKSSAKEVKLQYLLWNKDYVNAFNIACEIISLLSAPKLKGYKAFWQYYAGSIALKLGNDYMNKANELFRSASQNVLGITWLANLAEIQEEKVVLTAKQHGMDSIIERLEQKLVHFKTPAKLEKKITEILDGLTNAKGESFETYYEMLGDLLGYRASNPKGQGDPDPYWIVNDAFCIVSEVKIYDKEDHKIPIAHISQANRHEKWIRKKLSTLHDDAEVYTVFITNASSIEEEGRIYADEVYYLNKCGLVEWAHTALKVLRDCNNLFPGEGDIEWREHVIAEFTKHSITPADYIRMITTTKLSVL